VTTAALGETIALRLLTTLGSSYRVEIVDDGWAELRVGASVGLTLARAGDTAGALLARADGAMYRAKQAGRGRCAIA
jgi:GGDEF domain-containing protein